MRWLTTRTKAVLIALAIFILGAVCGALLDQYIPGSRYRPSAGRWDGRHRPPPDLKHRMLAFYERELDLTPEQKERLTTVLEESRSAMVEIRHGVREKMDTALRETKSRIRELLTPEQQEKFDRLGKRFRERRPRPPHGP